MLLSLMLPILIFIKAKNSKYKILLLTMASIISIPSIFTFLFAILDFTTLNNKNPFLTKLQELRVNNTSYILYLSNGGATTAYGIVLKKEQNLPLALKTVSTIFSKYRAKDANITLVNKNEIELKIAPYYKMDKEIIKRVKLNSK